MSPTLYFSIIFALSSFLNDEIISFLETQALPLNLSSLIKRSDQYVFERKKGDINGSVEFLIKNL